MTVLFISDKLREVREISDQVSVMRAGSLVGTVPTADATERSLAAMVVGRDLSLDVDRAPARRSKVTLHVRGLAYDAPTGQSLQDLGFDVAAGEIVGVAGIEGNGQSELAEILAGLRRRTAGTVTVDGTDTAGLDVAGHRRAGIGYVPEDRLQRCRPRRVHRRQPRRRPPRPPTTGPPRCPVPQSRPRPCRTAHRGLRGPRSGPVRRGARPVRRQPAEGDRRPRTVRRATAVDRPQVTRGVDIGAMRFMYEQLVAARDAGATVLLTAPPRP